MSYKPSGGREFDLRCVPRLARAGPPAHLWRVVETATPAKRWNSFVCPACRSIFRVARDHDGRGVVCPSCRGMLRLPGATAGKPGDGATASGTGGQTATTRAKASAQRAQSCRTAG